MLDKMTVLVDYIITTNKCQAQDYYSFAEWILSALQRDKYIKNRLKMQDLYSIVLRFFLILF